jgi:hypothetical protein
MKINEYDKYRAKSLQWFKKKAWDNFSVFVRLRDTDAEGYGKCCTCGKYIYFLKGDAGHYIGREDLLIDEINVNLQCKRCNRFKEGFKVKYKEFLIKKHGESVIDLLESRKRSGHKKDLFTWWTIIIHYQDEAEKLFKGKNFT